MNNLDTISPLDNRYRDIVASQANNFSEYALIKIRFDIEIEWVIFLLTNFNYKFGKISKTSINKILDFKKNSGWIHRSQLKKNSSFITLDTVILFSVSKKFSRPIAKIESGRLLNKKKCNLNWCRVETGEYKGWVLKENLWGLN